MPAPGREPDDRRPEDRLPRQPGEGDVSEDADVDIPVTESERVEMAGYVNSRNTIIAALAAFLGLSVLTNILVLLTR